MRLARPAYALALVALSLSAATAQERDQCFEYVGAMVNGTQVYNQILNMVMTDRWRESEITNDPQSQGKLSGLWYTQTLSPQGDMVQNLYLSFEPNGLFQYQDQTCPTQMAASCSQNYGTGEWTAHGQPDGSYAVMYRYSDLNRGSACAAFVGQMQGNMIYTTEGGRFQRAR